MKRTSLRTRLMVAIVATAAIVLALSLVATYALVRRSLQQQALSGLQKRASALVTFMEDPNAAARAPAIAKAFKLTDLRGVAVRPNGDVVEGAAGLPAPLQPADILPDRLLAGDQVSGRIGRTVYLAVPTTRFLARARVVVVATDTVDTSVLSRALPLLLLASLAVLAIASAVAVWLARRLTRPINAVERAAAQLATGDLSARADVPPSTDQELATLATTLNTMAAQLEASRGAERAFLLSVSHDLRTPLTSIRGYADALADGTLDDANPDDRKRAATVIAAESRRLERLVRDLLDLSRLDSKQFSLRPQSCDATEVVRDAALAFGPQAQELGIQLAVHPGGVLPIECDPERLAQIVANLVENALKYATAKVEVYAAAKSDRQFAIVVTDDGPGIPQSELGAVFERLYTVRSTPGRSVGTGLGLAIVRELATAMGGSAYADPNVESGTRFVVTLPRERV